MRQTLHSYRKWGLTEVMIKNILSRQCDIKFHLGFSLGVSDFRFLTWENALVHLKSSNSHEATIWQGWGCMYLGIRGGGEYSRHPLLDKTDMIMNYDPIFNRYANDAEYTPPVFSDIVQGTLPYLNVIKSYEFCQSKFHQRDKFGELCFVWDVDRTSRPVCNSCKEKEQIEKEENERKQQEIIDSVDYQRQLMTAKLRQKILKRDNYTCQNPNCNHYDESGAGLHIDHILPVSRGGKTKVKNLQVLCEKCNRDKFTKTNEEWLTS